ncbi:alpha/beta hydrolase fold [Lentzea fradiae]|uniref:Alpha/beta hydrolase fold n=1 Tax=Lentzea fradiae TaxID=200378 RepID=A0A1G7SF09_9PSEU|nr:alpha/beta fold hydrolase [Lentzea fradiae]SDG21492.1 alpha/beta hydrolase fold [Lentzea fradiae]
MRTPRATALRWAAATIAAVSLTAGSPATASPSPLKWTSCEDRPGFDCGTLTLPIDRGDPRLGTFEMAVARHRATDPARRIGVLVVNPGGPGESGVSFTFGARWTFSPEVLARFDVVGFDPRGIGRSQPVRCSTGLVFGGPGSHPGDAAGFERLREHGERLHQDCARHTGPIIDHLSTDDVVADVDALRRALGESRISYYGLSYGTVIGQRLAELHGGTVRAMVLDSVVDRGVNAREYVASAARAAADSFEEWRRWNELTPSSPLHGQDVVALWDDLMAKAARGELATPDDPATLLTVHDLGNTLTTIAYLPDWAELSTWVLSLRETVSSSAATKSADGPESLFPSPMRSITCADRDFRVRTYAEYDALTRLERRISPRTAGSARGNNAITGCLGSPEARTPQRPGVMRTSVPVLLLNNRYDPSTPHEWAVSVRRQQPHATVLVTYEGAGHGTYDRSDCTIEVSDAYLTSLALPRDGFSCPVTS